MTEILVTGGARGDSGHAQSFDLKTFDGDTVVWRRSVPHANETLYLNSMLSFLHPYNVTVIIVIRNWDVIEKAQMITFKKRKDAARESVKRAYHDIFAQVISNQVDFIVVPYESLVLHPEKSQQALLSRLGLQGPSVPIRNENTKHWGEK